MNRRRPFDQRVFEKNFAMEQPPLVDEPFQFDEQLGVPEETDPVYGEPNEAVGDYTPPPVQIQDRRTGKPFGFALAHGENGASIWWGQLVACVCTGEVTRVDGKVTTFTQAEIQGPTYYPPSNLDTDTRLQTHLGWYGAVFLYWEADENGAVTNCEVKGPDTPDGQNIGELDADLNREITDGRYYVQIGEVPENGLVDQKISGDVPWFATIFKGSSSGSSDSGGSGDSAPSSDESSAIGSGGSSKDTAIVQGPNGTYLKWYAMEASEVLFFDFQEFRVGHGTTKIEIDPVVLFCLEKDTARAFGSPDVGNVNIVVEGPHLKVSPRFSKRHRQQTVQVMIKGVRRCFAGVRNGHATFGDLVDNECRLNPRMTREQVVEQLAKHGITS